MPDLDKNYLAGLYLDEITLDVMPQEYIDAALEVKLRHDACAPRAGYVCVQDRRVKGGFYYRKAPQGQGVNALPPSRLERALARSQEQPRPRSEMGFLSKAAIGAGLTIGGLALTGAVINAGRSSEPYQEPPRRVQPPPMNNNAARVGLGVAAAATATTATVLGRRGGSEAEVQETKVQPDEVQPIVDQQTEATPSTKPSKGKPKNTEEAEGFNEQSAQNKGLVELSSAGYLRQKNAYEAVLKKQLIAKGEVPEEAERRAKDLQLTGEEGFVRIEDVRGQMGGRITKNARDIQSQRLQELYDKLKDLGLEDAIEFRGAVNKGTGAPASSANKYSINLRDGKGVIQVGEMRFKKPQAELQQAIAEKIKNPTTESQPPTKSAKPKAEKPKPVEPPTPETRTTNPEEAKQEAIGRLGRAIRIAAPSADGYVNQSSLLNDKVLKSRLAGNDPVDLIAEGIEEGRIQVKKTGKNTYIRDVSVIPAKDFAAEALSLNDVKNKDSDRRVKDLREALEYKRRKATTDEEKQGIAELEAAIAGIQEVKPSDRGGKNKPPTAKPDGEGVAPPPPPPKKTKAEKQAEIDSVVEGIASIQRPSELIGAKAKFTIEQQEIFAENASAEKKAAVGTVLASFIEDKAISKDKREEYTQVYEFLIGEKYSRSKSSAVDPSSEPTSKTPAPASNPTDNPSAPPADTSNQETTRSQSTSAKIPLPTRKMNRDETARVLREGGGDTSAISWAKRSGLLDDKANPTEMGRIIKSADPYLDSEVSQWAVHTDLALGEKNDKGGMGWFVNDFVPTHPTFTRATLVRAAESQFNVNNADAIASKMLDVYTNPKEGLSRIPLVSQNPDKTYAANTGSQAIRQPPLEIEAYVVARIVEKDFNGSGPTVETDKLLPRVASVFGVNYSQAQDVLDRLSGSGVIEQMKNVPPFQVVPRWNSSSDLLKKAFTSSGYSVGEPDKDPPQPSSSSTPAENPPASTKKRSRSSKSANTATSTVVNKPALEIDLKTLQANINKMEATAKTLEEALSRIQAGKKPLKASQPALSNMGINISEFGALDSVKQISKLQKAIAYQREQIEKKQQEGRDFVDRLQNNDAIAPSEAYLSAYWEIRNKYRRAG